MTAGCCVIAPRVIRRWCHGPNRSGGGETGNLPEIEALIAHQRHDDPERYASHPAYAVDVSEVNLHIAALLDTI